MDTKLLEEFGLTRNEINIFLTLIRNGTLGSSEIAKETGLNRPYIYYALERLREKGYISEVKVENKKKFKSLDLDLIASSENHKLEALIELFKQLKKLQKQKENTSVEMLKGKYAIKNIFKKILAELNPKEELLIIGVDETKMESLEPVYMKKIFNQYIKNKNTERVIIKKGGRRIEYAQTTKYRELDEKLIGNTVKFIYQDTVIDIIYGTTIHSIIVKNKDVANTSRKQFEIFWKIART